MSKAWPFLRILVVDDEPLIRWSLVETLSACGHDVVAVADGSSAIQAATSVDVPFDVALLDFRLPDSNDLTLLARLHRLVPATRIILTALKTARLA